MEPIKTYRFETDLSKEELQELEDIFTYHMFFPRSHKNNKTFHYDIWYDRSISSYILDIFSIRILAHVELQEKLFPFYFKMILIAERNIDHLILL